jgi:hypothetical protein
MQLVGQGLCDTINQITQRPKRTLAATWYAGAVKAIFLKFLHH